MAEPAKMLRGVKYGMSGWNILAEGEERFSTLLDIYALPKSPMARLGIDATVHPTCNLAPSGLISQYYRQ